MYNQNKSNKISPAKADSLLGNNILQFTAEPFNLCCLYASRFNGMVYWLHLISKHFKYSLHDKLSKTKHKTNVTVKLNQVEDKNE